MNESHASPPSPSPNFLLYSFVAISSIIDLIAVFLFLRFAYLSVILPVCYSLMNIRFLFLVTLTLRDVNLETRYTDHYN
ncbi:hypothetical protein B0H34DRAFT_286884 [Crassisporium funariophilum]|nr:hypothetical protein B0H34DRAFT_286884 [Crassisporium funariophilum]